MCGYDESVAALSAICLPLEVNRSNSNWSLSSSIFEMLSRTDSGRSAMRVSRLFI